MAFERAKSPGRDWIMESNEFQRHLISPLPVQQYAHFGTNEEVVEIKDIVTTVVLKRVKHSSNCIQ